MNRNRCSRSTRISVHVQPESVFTINRITHPLNPANKSLIPQGSARARMGIPELSIVSPELVPQNWFKKSQRPPKRPYRNPGRLGITNARVCYRQICLEQIWTLEERLKDASHGWDASGSLTCPEFTGTEPIMARYMLIVKNIYC